MEPDLSSQPRTPQIYSGTLQAFSAFQPVPIETDQHDYRQARPRESMDAQSEPRHPIPSLELEDLEAVFENTDNSEKQFAALFRDHIADVDESIWINLLTCVYNAFIPKKQGAWIIKQVGNYVRDNFQPNFQLSDYHRVQRRAVLIGYTILAILELKNSREDDIFSENQKYFVALTEKELVKESIKIGLYTQKVIEKSQKDIHEKEQGYHIGSLFTKFLESIHGNSCGARRKMLIDWTSMERMSRFKETMSSLHEHTNNTEGSFAHQSSNRQEETSHHQTGPFQTLETNRAFHSHVKEPIIIQTPPEHEATSCNESHASEPADLDNFSIPFEDSEKVQQKPLVIIQDPQEQGVNQKQQTPINRALEAFEPEVEAIPLNADVQNGGQEPEGEILCSTADTSNMNTQVVNADNLPEINIVLEQEEQNKETIQEIKDLKEPAADQNDKKVDRPEDLKEVNSEDQENIQPKICVSEDPSSLLLSNDSEFVKNISQEASNQVQEKIDKSEPDQNQIEEKPMPQASSEPVVERCEEKGEVSAEVKESSQ